MLEFLKSIKFVDKKNSFGPSFYYLWFGQTISMIGASLFEFAIGIWIYQKTGSVLNFSIVIAISILPSLLLLPFAGIIVDRFNRFYLMIISDILSALLILLLILLLWQGTFDLKYFYLLNICMSIIGCVRGPAYSASLSELLPIQKYTNASGLIGISDDIVNIISPIVAGGLVISIGLEGIACINFITFCLGSLLILRAFFTAGLNKISLHLSNPSNKIGFTVVKDFFCQQPLMLIIFFYDIFFAVCLAFASDMLAPKMLSDYSAQHLGIMYSFGFVGGLLGSITLAFVKAPRNVIPFILIGDIIISCCITLLGFDMNFYIYCICFFVVLFSTAVTGGYAQSLWMRKVPLQFQGRVFSLHTFAFLAASLIFTLLGGWSVEKIIEPALSNGGILSMWLEPLIGTSKGRGLGLIFILCGVVGIVLSSAALTTRLRHLDLIVPDANVNSEDEQVAVIIDKVNV